jgi:glycine/D-amino acid oxidase-like deaminating enzyme
VLLIERGELNCGASGQNAGSLHFQIERRFLEHGDALAKQASRVVALNLIAIEAWRDLPAVLGPNLDIVMNGGLMIAETPEEMEVLERKSASEAEYGVATSLLDAAQVRSMAPYLSRNILGASWLADEGHANPRILTLAFAKAAAVAGAIFRTRTTVRAISRSGTRFDVSLDGQGGTERVAASQLLVAAGAWTARVGAAANVHLPVFPAGLTMSITERTAPFIGHLIQHVGKRLSMKQSHEGNVLIGGGYPSRLVCDANGEFDLARAPELVPHALRDNLRAAVGAVPSVAELNLIRTWTGMVALTPDQLPIVGEVPQLPGFHVCAGGSGFTLGPVFARYLGETMSGRVSDLAKAFDIFSPARFSHLNGFMG